MKERIVLALVVFGLLLVPFIDMLPTSLIVAIIALLFLPAVALAIVGR